VSQLQRYLCGFALAHLILSLFLLKIDFAQGDFPHSEDPYEFLPIPMMLAEHLEWG
jgi:hypothetical protein